MSKYKEREFQSDKATCCVMAKEKLLFEPHEKKWFHYDDRFDEIYYCPWCGVKLEKTTIASIEVSEDEVIEAIELLYANRTLDDDCYLTITGKNVRELITELESAKRCNKSFLQRLVAIKHGIRSIVIDDGRGQLVILVKEVPE